MEEEKVYPQLSASPNILRQPSAPENPPDGVPIFIDIKNLEERFKAAIFRERCVEIKLQKSKVDDKLKHYTKIKNRWNTANSTLKYTGFSLMIVSGATATILTSLVTAGIAIPVIAVLSVSGAGLLHGSLFEIIINKLTSKKKTEFRKRINNINEYKNKLYLLFEKARNDGEISNNELEAIRKLTEEYQIKFDSEIRHHEKEKMKKEKDELKKLGKDIKIRITELKHHGAHTSDKNPSAPLQI